MINGAILAVIALAVVVNGIDTEALPMWRQMAYPILGVAAYLHGRHLAARYGAQVLLVAAGLAGLIAVIDFDDAVSALMVLGVFVMLPWFAGRYRRQQAELLRAREERVERLERERGLVAERAQAQERARIAADLHDSVGHDLALIALRAGAMELAPGLAGPDREAAAALRASAVEATDRLRHALGMLRVGTAPMTPFDEPVAALVERSAGAGMAVRLEMQTEAEPLRPLVDRAVYRVVQEALTNAAKHAPGEVVTVQIKQEKAVVRVTVVNAKQENEAQAAVQGGADPDSEPAADGGSEAMRWTDSTDSMPWSVSGGSGLAGLAERVRLLGGTFGAGPRGSGFAVEAELPVRGNA